MRAPILIAVLLLTLPGVALAETLAIVGGTVHAVSSDPYVGTVVVRDGVIAAAGPGVSAPAGARVIDAAGHNVYPGIFDGLSQIGLVEIGSIDATDDRAEMGNYNAHLDAATAVHPASALIGVARDTGLTHALIAPRASGGAVIPGRATLANLAGWTIEEMAVERSLALVIRWPAIQTRSFDWSTFSWKDAAFKDAEEKAKEKQDELRDWLDAARHYRMAMGVEDPRAETDLQLAHLAQVLDRGQKVVVQVNAKRDIEGAVEFAEEQDLDIVLAGGRDAWMVADMLAEKGIGVILSGPQTLPNEQDDPYDQPFRAPSMLAEAGVKFGMGSGASPGWGGGPHSARTLPFHAAVAAGYGLSEADALASLTLWPAELLGVGDRLGSIEEGKIANLVVTTGRLTEIMSQVEHLIIGGREVGTDNHHRDLYETYRARGSR